MSTEAISLRRLNYNKTIFGRGSAPDPAGKAHYALSDPWVGPVMGKS